eukprot:1073520-Pleurochrysis_carterae.AAC.2
MSCVERLSGTDRRRTQAKRKQNQMRGGWKVYLECAEMSKRSHICTGEQRRSTYIASKRCCHASKTYDATSYGNPASFAKSVCHLDERHRFIMRSVWLGLLSAARSQDRSRSSSSA